MAFTKLTTDLDIIQGLPDRPNQSATALKKKFDDAGNIIKTFINGLIDQMNSPGAAANIKITTISGVTGSTIQAALESLKQQINDAAVQEIPDGSIITAKLQDGAVTYKKIGKQCIQGSVNGNQNSNIALNSITSANIVDGGIETDKIANYAITQYELADNAVIERTIADGAVTTAKIGDGEVKTANLDDGAVTNEKINDGAVKTNKLDDGSVTVAKTNFVNSDLPVGGIVFSNSSYGASWPADPVSGQLFFKLESSGGVFYYRPYLFVGTPGEWFPCGVI